MSGSPVFLSRGDMAAWLRSMDADQREEFDMVQGMAIVVQVGCTNLYQIGLNHIDVHSHDTAEQAAECYATTVAEYRRASRPDSPARMLVEALSSPDPEATLLSLVQARGILADALPQASAGPTGMYL